MRKRPPGRHARSIAAAGKTKAEIQVNARAIWQGTLTVQKHQIAVKLFSAVLDRQIHFHLLHKTDRTRVQQRMVDEETHQPVDMKEVRKAFEAKPGVFIAITPEEIEAAEPEPNRDVTIRRFVPLKAIEPQLFDRPYYLGPTDDSATDYFALVQALDKKKTAGIAAWVMRKHSYVGALYAEHGYLLLNTLRHADEVIPSSQLEAPQGRALEPKEKALAEKLVEALSGDFQPEGYHDEFQARVRELIEAKRAGKKVKAKRAPKRRVEKSLAEALQASLKETTKGRSA
jgi:DNA end-binding protein Ku